MPVLNHETHDKTILKDGEKYGCYNHIRMTAYMAPDRLYYADGSYKEVQEKVYHVMSKDCRYDKSLSDQRCSGCMAAGSGEAYAEMVRSQGA